MHDDEFFDNQMDDFKRTFGFMAAFSIILNFLIGSASLILTCTIIYFFLAAAGIVPPHDVVPYIPYI